MKKLLFISLLCAGIAAQASEQKPTESLQVNQSESVNSNTTQSKKVASVSLSKKMLNVGANTAYGAGVGAALIVFLIVPIAILSNAEYNSEWLKIYNENWVKRYDGGYAFSTLNGYIVEKHVLESFVAASLISLVTCTGAGLVSGVYKNFFSSQNVTSAEETDSL